ncbi:hypothetical protein F4819DRAFT_258302 [Hypoxylon fuscum]|nr:hypothetical protein F4819DRAFT_258302 [Hypoxylon fuscum]
MVNGMERLERFFGGSRKKEKERGVKHRDGSIVSPQRQPKISPHFPSPSFMRPTSIHMRPREEQVTWASAVKERSQSLPDPHATPRRRSSIGSTSMDPKHKHHPSDPIRKASLSITRAEGPLISQGLSSFRFPEDVLFKNELVNALSRDGPAEDHAHEYTDQEDSPENILDWRPQRISSLFNTLGLETSIDDRLARYSADSAKLPALKPSPILSTPPSPKTKLDSSLITPRRSSRTSSDFPARKLTLFPRHDALSSFSKPYPDSPPPSDGEEDFPNTSLARSTSRKGLASPIQFTPRQSTESKSQDRTKIIASMDSSRECRESWGTRYQDHVVGRRSAAVEQDYCFLRKSTSESSLSTIIKHTSIDRDLREPTLDDFYALSDDDIAEDLPSTPGPDLDIPPTPPPKDSPKTIVGRSRSTRHAPIAPTTAVNPSSGELTPPCTPTDSQFLALTYSPTNASGALGAMWAASIANTYNFDLVYVISLWPNGEGIDSDPSRRASLRGRDRKESNVDQVAAQCAIVDNPKSGMTGRLLAAYGLSEFGSPFRVHAQFHTKMLGFGGWKEYRDELASPGMISRGWTCSFYSDHTPTKPNGTDGEHQAHDGMVNRGIVFAAYTRKTTKSTIPVRSSPKQTAILGKLFYDAQTLVDALVHGV